MGFKDFISAIKSLRQAATLPDGERALATARAKAGLSEWSTEVMLPRMLKELESDSVETQRSAISALRAAGLDAIDAVPALMAYFDRTDSPKNSDVQKYARKEAAYAVEEIMRKARQLVEQEENYQRQRPQQPVAAPEDNEELLQTQADLTAATRDRSPDVRIAALYAMARLDRPRAVIAPILSERLDDDDERVRAAAAAALGQLR